MAADRLWTDGRGGAQTSQSATDPTLQRQLLLAQSRIHELQTIEQNQRLQLDAEGT